MPYSIEARFTKSERQQWLSDNNDNDDNNDNHHESQREPDMIYIL